MMKHILLLLALFCLTTSTSAWNLKWGKKTAKKPRSKEVTPVKMASSNARCSDAEILDGTCVDACTCPCGDGLGVWVNSVPEADCDEPERVCMDAMVAYDATLGGKATCLLDCPVEDEDCGDEKDGSDSSDSSDDKGHSPKSKKDGSDSSNSSDDKGPSPKSKKDGSDSSDSSDDKGPSPKSKKDGSDSGDSSDNKGPSEKGRPPSPKFKTCSEQEVMSGSCPDACGCSCFSSTHGPGFLVETVKTEDCTEPAERFCMGKMIAYTFVKKGEMKCADECKKQDVATDDSSSRSSRSGKNKKVKNRSGKDKDSSSRSGKNKKVKSRSGKDKDSSSRSGKNKKVKNRPAKDKDGSSRSGKNKKVKSHSDKDKDSSSRSGKDKKVKSGKRKKITVCRRAFGRRKPYQKVVIDYKDFKKYMDSHEDNCLPGDELPGYKNKVFVDKRCNVVGSKPKDIDDEPCDGSDKPLRSRRKPRFKSTSKDSSSRSGKSPKNKNLRAPKPSKSGSKDSSSRSGRSNKPKRKRQPKRKRPTKDVELCHYSNGRYQLINVKPKDVKKRLDVDRDCFPGDVIPGSNGKKRVDHKCNIIGKPSKPGKDSSSRSGRSNKARKPSKDSSSRSGRSNKAHKPSKVNSSRSGRSNKARKPSKEPKDRSDGGCQAYMVNHEVAQTANEIDIRLDNYRNAEGKGYWRITMSDAPYATAANPVTTYGWCVDFGRRISSGVWSVDVFSAYDKDIHPKAVDKPDMFPNLAYLINKHNVGDAWKSNTCEGTVDWEEMQGAVWMLIDDKSGEGTRYEYGRTSCISREIAEDARVNGEDYELDCANPNEQVPLVLVTDNTKEVVLHQTIISETNVHSVPGLCECIDDEIPKSKSPKDSPSRSGRSNKAREPSKDSPSRSGRSNKAFKPNKDSSSRSGRSNKARKPSKDSPSRSGRSNKTPKPSKDSSSRSGRSNKAPKPSKDSSSRSGRSNKTQKPSKNSSNRSGRSSKAPKKKYPLRKESNSASKDSSSRSGRSSRSGKSKQAPKPPKPSFKTCSEFEIRSRSCPDLCQCPCSTDSGMGVYVADGNTMSCMDAVDAYDRTVMTGDMVCLEKCPTAPKPEPLPEPKPLPPVEPQCNEQTCWDGSRVMPTGFNCEYECPPKPEPEPPVGCQAYRVNHDIAQTTNEIGIQLDGHSNAEGNGYWMITMSAAPYATAANPVTTYGWCVDYDRFLDAGDWSVDVFSAFDKDIHPKAVDKPKMFPNLAYMINTHNVGDYWKSDTCEGTVDWEEMQGAVWMLIDEEDGTGTQYEYGRVNCISEEIAEDARVNGQDYELNCANPNEQVPLVMVFDDVNEIILHQTIISETNVHSVPGLCECIDDVNIDDRTVSEPEPEEPSGGCETAFAYDPITKSCFSDYGFERWGWVIPISPGSYDFEIYAGAADCDINKGTKVGNLECTWDGSGEGTVTFLADGDYKFEQTHFNLGYEPLPTDKNGETTVAPGEYSIGHEVCENSKVDHITFTASPWPKRDSEIYIIAHAVSCDDW